MIKLKNILKESPDEVYLGNGRAGLSLFDDDAYPFYYDLRKKRLYIANIPGDDHFSMQGTPGNKGLGQMIGGYHAGGDPNNEFIYGRIWITHKIMSFWEYPADTKDMKIVADSLSDHFFLKKKKNINVWNNFKVEIYEDDDEYNSNSYNVDDYDLEPNEIIPVKSYKRSYNPPDEELQQHLLSPMSKKQIDVPANVGSKRTPTGLSATQRHQMRSTSEIKESPDTVIPHGERMTWSNDDALGFLLDTDGELLVTGWGGLHTDLDDMESFYEGRIWTEPKVVSFWDYPIPRKFVDIAKKLKDKTKIDILSPGWTIEIFIEGENRAEFVPTVEYGEVANKIENPSQQEYQKHLDRAKKDIPKGWGSKKRPADMTATRRHQMRSTSEGLNEWADELIIKKNNIDYMLDFEDDDAIPFGYKNGTMEIGEIGDEHGSANIPNNTPQSYAGRLWFNRKILSFWIYPDSVAKMNELVKDLNVTLSNYDDVLPKRIEITNDWRIDVPQFEKNNNLFNMFNVDMGGSIDYNIHSDLVSIKDWHPDMISKSKDFKDKLQKQHQMHMLSPIAKSVTDMPNVGSKKTPAGLSATRRHQIRSTSEIKESPDRVEATKDGRKVAFSHSQREAYVFGYSRGKFYIEEDSTHFHMPPSGVEREDYKYPGRLWTDEKVISFWEYPKDRKDLYRVIRDIEKNTEIVVDKKQWYIDILIDDKSKEIVKNIMNHMGNFNHALDETANAVLIPVEEYEGSLDNNINIKHMIIPIMKSMYGLEVPEGWGSKKTTTGLSATQRHQMKSTSEGLKEWADGFMMNGEWHDEYDDYDNTIVFGYGKRGLEYDFGSVHGQINIKVVDSELKKNYAGRVWIKEKVIAFWGYPESKEKLKEIVFDLNSEIKWLHINNGWKVEIPTPLLSKKYVKQTKGKKLNFKYKKAFKHKDEDESIFIPIKDYDISLISNSPEAKKKKKSAMLQHMVSPMYKQTKSIAGIGSRKTPSGLSATQIHQVKSTSENKD